MSASNGKYPPTEVQPRASRRRFTAAYTRQFNDFTAHNQGWGGDITVIPTREGFLYVASLQDFFSRRIVELVMDDHIG